MNSGAQFETREFLREQHADFPERSTCTVAQRTERTFVRGGFVAAAGKWSHGVVIVQSEAHFCGRTQCPVGALAHGLFGHIAISVWLAETRRS